jgi:hypothetical protein
VHGAKHKGKEDAADNRKSSCQLLVFRSGTQGLERAQGHGDVQQPCSSRAVLAELCCY